jgi:predicted nucleic acid-binding protein
VIIVSDTSPIRALGFLELLPLLSELFERVLVPPAVEAELLRSDARYAAIDLSNFSFIEVRAPQDKRRVEEFLQALDLGESEALVLAIENGVRLILMDEFRGRSVATQVGIQPLGALGVLLRAKSRGLIGTVRPLIERLDKLEFYMSAQLKENVLRLAGE